MKNLITITLISIALSTLHVAGAQQIPSAETNQPATNVADPTNDKRISTLSFSGENLLYVVQTLRQEFPDINFLLPSLIQDTPVFLSLKNVTLDEILDALRFATRGDQLTVEKLNNRMVAFGKSSAPGSGGIAPTIFRAFNIRPYLAGHTAEEQEHRLQNLDKLINQAWNFVQLGDRTFRMPRTKLHAGTQILFVVGDDRSIQMVQQIIEALTGMENTQTIAAKTPSEKPVESVGENNSATTEEEK